MKNAEFYTIATPIGNLKDISQRAIEVLSSSDYIACEDKRVSSILLSHFKISKPLIVYQKHNEQEASEKILELLKQGETVALISDAGAPCISDPGKIIVKKLYEKGIRTIHIPGASAITTILASAPRETEDFAFCGFLPRTQNTLLDVTEKYKFTDMIFYESPKRLIDSLKLIKIYRGENQMVCIGRELTKKFEEIIYDNISNIINHFEKNTLKGEIVGILYSKKDENKNYETEIKKLLASGFSAKDTATIIAKLFDTNKKEIYAKAVSLKN